MTLEFSEIVYYSRDPAASAKAMSDGFGWEVVETYSDSWVLLATQGGGKVGFMRHGDGDSAIPPPMAAFRSRNIDSDILALRQNGLEINEAGPAKGAMRHTVFSDADGNKFLIWEGEIK